MMKIKSKTDVITNSSTEVFTYVTDDSIKSLKDLINSVLEISGSSKTCDDCFKIEPVIDDPGFIKECFEDEFERPPKNDEELLRFAHSEHEDILNYMEGRPVFRSLKVIPVSEEYLEAAETITNNLNQIYKSDEFYS